MAYQGWSTTDFLRSAALVTAVPFTVSCWARTSLLGSATAQVLVSFCDAASGYANNCFLLFMSASGSTNCYAGSAGGNQANSFPSVAVADTTFHSCGVWAANNSRFAYCNGIVGVEDTASQTPAGIDRFSIGAFDGTTVNHGWAPAGTGYLSEVAVWDVALAAIEVAALAAGVHPYMIRPASLIGYYPIFGRQSQEPNLLSSTTPLVIQGSLTRAEHPRIFRPSPSSLRRRVILPPDRIRVSPIFVPPHF